MYPSLKELVALEIETLNTIASMSDFRKFEGLYRKSSTRTFFKAMQTFDWHADFLLDVRVRGDKRKSNCERWVHIGAFAEGNAVSGMISRTSYSVVLFRGDSVHSPVIRKLHFDYEAVANRNIGDPKPSSHIQMCGKASPHLIKQGFNAQRLSGHYPGFEQPRIPGMPTSLALLLDWIFTEFQTDRNIRSIHNNRQWINQVINAEKVVLRPYFEAAAEHIASASNDESPFVRKFMYGLP